MGTRKENKTFVVVIQETNEYREFKELNKQNENGITKRNPLKFALCDSIKQASFPRFVSLSMTFLIYSNMLIIIRVKQFRDRVRGSFF
jgi:hypothetical protein